MSQSPKVDFSSLKKNISNESSIPISKNEETQSNIKKINSFKNISQDNKNFIEKKTLLKETHLQILIIIIILLEIAQL